MMRRTVNGLILLGALAFIAAIFQKIIVFFLPDALVLGLFPTAYLRFSGMSLLLAIAISARELAFKEK